MGGKEEDKEKAEKVAAAKKRVAQLQKKKKAAAAAAAAAAGGTATTPTDKEVTGEKSEEGATEQKASEERTTEEKASEERTTEEKASEERATEDKPVTQAPDAVDPDEEAFNAVIQSAAQGDQPAPDTEADAHVDTPSPRIEELEREIQILAREAAEHEARWRKTEQALEQLREDAGSSTNKEVITRLRTELDRIRPHSQPDSTSAEVDSLRKQVESKDSAIADLKLELSTLRSQPSPSDGHGSQISTLSAKVTTLEAENAKLREKSRRAIAGTVAADDDALDELEDEERNKLTSRIRELEGQVFDLQRGQWREKRASLQPDIDSASIPRHSIDPGEAFHEVDLSAGNGPSSVSARMSPARSLQRQQQQQQQKHSNLTQYISSGINAFLPSATSPPPQSPWSRPRNDSLLQDFDDAPFDEAAFAHAQREEEARKMLVHVREVKTGLRNWKSWRLDLVDARRAQGGPWPIFDI